jgi:(1->4)-alpha-D-glucan 1-alpha-D-glucosylmutase
VHERQSYELINFRRADAELNYRRFFAVTTLAAIRVERPEVFAASHTEIDYWLEQGWADGLRVDHPDGLADPAGYLRDLAGLTGGGYTLVEKILEPGEELPADWACAGTTGYETLALVDRLLVDPAGQDRLDRLDRELRGARSEQSDTVGWTDLVHTTKRAVADTILRAEVLRLARLLPDLADPDVTADAIAEVLACFGVYRSYLPDGEEHLAAALAIAQQRRPDLAGAIADVGAEARRVGTEYTVRLQQTSGAVMAKGVEDCAFYRYPRLTSLTEVGGDPSDFSVTVDEFHREQRRRLAAWPDGMTTLSTHDTKRGEDVRARIDVLSEIPDDWATAVSDWLSHTGLPDRVLGNLLLQAAVGAWPIERDRLHGYAEKAAREAGDSTRWIDPDTAFERRMHALVDACYDDRVLAPAVTAMADRIRPFGWSNSLAAKLIQLTLPGVPDVYRGTELWQNSLVDPDNRRPFDASVAADLLDRLDSGWQPPVDESGAVKLLVTSRALRARRDRPELFTGYLPVTASGPAADHLVGFDRGGAVTLATRLPVGLAAAGGWGDTGVALPAGWWTDVLTGRAIDLEAGDQPVPVVDLLDHYPVALLLRDS